MATVSRPRTARQLSEILDIPIVVCYRKIKLLESLGLLSKVATLYSPKGKGVALYSSQLKDAKIFYSRNRLSLSLKLPRRITEKNRSHTRK